MKNLNEKIVKILKDKNKTISFMESCTGGFLANKITNVSGASNVLKVSLVTYSNEYKIKFGVAKDVIIKYTVYSKETAVEMARNVAIFADSNYGVGVTGELANLKQEENKVYYCIYDKDNHETICNMITVEQKNREEMKECVAKNILEELWNILTKN